MPSVLARVAIEVLWGLFQAWVIKLGNDMSRVKLPPLGNMARLSAQELAFATKFADTAVTHGARWTGRKCFFRAFILACLLRRRGVPVALNVGLCSLHQSHKGKRIDGHCWLTLNDNPYLENATMLDHYPHFLATGLNGVRYWLGFQPARGAERDALDAPLESAGSAKESAIPNKNIPA